MGLGGGGGRRCVYAFVQSDRSLSCSHRQCLKLKAKLNAVAGIHIGTD